ncbi:MAG TPA: hypothetical protein VJU15_01970 [Gemmatimonadales bacterium]|nr:hypothetical protein [Gemmatimonadales bacterium]
MSGCDRLCTLLFTLCASCATTGATLNSGVGDKMLEHPPWFAGRNDPVSSSAIGHFAIAYQRGATQEVVFEPAGGPTSPMGKLIVEMNSYLDSLRAKNAYDARLPSGAVPPDVSFGCPAALGGDCLEKGDSLIGGGTDKMRLAIGRPSQQWIQYAARLAVPDGNSHSLVITVELSQYLLRQKGILGKKVLELGTGYTVNFPWLTSLDTPVQVVQLTGALVAHDGRAVRIAAEGMLARRTDLLTSSIGGQNLITDGEIALLRDQRREDLPGQPLVWQVAMRNLLIALTRDGD